MTSDPTPAADIRVRGARDAYEIAAVVALLRRHEAPSGPTGLTAWKQTRRAALTARTDHRPAHREPRP